MALVNVVIQPSLVQIHRRTGQHPFGGADRVLPEWIQWGGGGGGSRIFPGSIFCGVVFPLTAVTDPKLVLFFPLTALFKHVLCFARIMSTLCPNSCRQTARIGGAAAPPSRTPMSRSVLFETLTKQLHMGEGVE